MVFRINRTRTVRIYTVTIHHELVGNEVLYDSSTAYGALMEKYRLI